MPPSHFSSRASRWSTECINDSWIHSNAKLFARRVDSGHDRKIANAAGDHRAMIGCTMKYIGTQTVHSASTESRRHYVKIFHETIPAFDSYLIHGHLCN